MADIQNTFIKSKMNKDLDDRLVPTGEYRNAQNISISRSEGSDVGALENVLGNSKISVTDLGIPNLDVIGFLADNATNYIYLFLTDYTDVSSLNNIFAPSGAQCFIYRYNTTTANTPPTKLAEGRFLNFSKNSPIIGVNLLEDLLFWTDNRNQPRKINVQSAANTSGYYISEDTISVAKPAPVESIKLVNIAQGLPLESTMTNPSEALLPDEASANPDYLSDWAGDPNYLKDRFIRFSYRYKFDDGEYSLIAPFTQVCFIPKQQGYFLDGDQEAAYRSTVVQFFENNVTQIGLNVKLPSSDMRVAQHVIELDILFKESDGIALKVVDTIPIDTVTSVVQTNKTDYSITDNIYNYTYTSTKPYKTLPADQTTRVYDMVPVKALAQEVAGNRVMYGNFIDKNTPPKSIDYGVGFSNKDFNASVNSQVEYPNHTIKQNRNYQVGIVLSDRFGRQSSVILSSKDEDQNGQTVGSVEFGGSTIYVPYYSLAPSTILAWPGSALKVVFDTAISSDSNTQGEPGLYSVTNPLGWYSYKVVVRQTEQDYYNVYLPSILNGYPYTSVNTPTGENNKTANIVLINDNINKIPRDLSEVGPDQKQYRSSVQIFGRVDQTSSLNKQYYPGSASDTVVSISTIADTNYNNTKSTTLVLDYIEFYQSETNPLIGRVSTKNAIGTISDSGTYNITLGVYETEPVESLLDIYWETSSTGLISELNTLIAGGISYPATIDLDTGYSQNEGMGIGEVVVNNAFVRDTSGGIITSGITFTLDSVFNTISGNPSNITGRFTLVDNGDGTFDVKTGDYFYYGSQSDSELRNFVFYVNVNLLGSVTTLSFNGSFSNSNPSIDSSTCGSSILYGGTSPDYLVGAPQTGVNGMNVGAPYVDKVQGLLWNIESVTLDGTDVTSQNVFAINAQTGQLSNPNNNHQENKQYAVTLGLQDEGGAIATPCSLNVTFGAVAVAPRIVITDSLVYSPPWLAIWSDGNTQTIVQDTAAQSNGDIPVLNSVNLRMQTQGGGTLVSNHKYVFTNPNGTSQTYYRYIGQSSVVDYEFTGIITSTDLCKAEVTGNLCYNYKLTPSSPGTSVSYIDCSGVSQFKFLSAVETICAREITSTVAAVERLGEC